MLSYNSLDLVSPGRQEFQDNLIWTSLWDKKSHIQGFPGGAVVKNQPANAGDAGLMPGL